MPHLVVVEAILGEFGRGYTDNFTAAALPYL